jgi:hypothetical protein
MKYRCRDQRRKGVWYRLRWRVSGCSVEWECGLAVSVVRLSIILGMIISGESVNEYCIVFDHPYGEKACVRTVKHP